MVDGFNTLQTVVSPHHLPREEHSRMLTQSWHNPLSASCQLFTIRDHLFEISLQKSKC